MKTTVVNLKSERCDIKICRTQDNRIPKAPANGCFGNPFFLKDIDNDEERKEVIRKYKQYFDAKIEMDYDFRDAVLALRGKKLGCFCKQPDKNVACHGDVIVEWLENNVE